MRHLARSSAARSSAALALASLLLAACASDPDDDAPAPAPNAAAPATDVFLATCDTTPPNLTASWLPGAPTAYLLLPAFETWHNLCGMEVGQVDQLPTGKIWVNVIEFTNGDTRRLTGDRLEYQIFGWRPGFCPPHSTFCTLARWVSLASGTVVSDGFSPPYGEITVPTGYKAIRVAARAIRQDGVVQPVEVDLVKVP